jgi:hypothetical protein
MDDRERMLAEGPREAPEPRTAEAIAAREKLQPTPGPKAEPTRNGGGSSSGPSWYRFIPLALVAGLMGARALGVGGMGRVVVVAAMVVVGVLAFLRRRNR